MVFKNFLFVLILFLNFSYNIIGLDLEKIDTLHYEGLYKNSYIEIKKEIGKNYSDPALIWRIGGATFVIADQMPWYQLIQKIEKFDEGSNRDRASIIHWYVSNLALKSFTIGIFNSFNNLDEIIEYNELAIRIDPTYADPYYFKASLNEILPSFLGGDRVLMGYYFSFAIKYTPTDINILIDAAKAFHKRNWDVDKIQKEYEKLDLNIFSSLNINDNEYSINLIKKAIDIYESNKNPSYHDKIKIEEDFNLKKNGWLNDSNIIIFIKT